jgi:hypothetical protein
VDDGYPAPDRVVPFTTCFNKQHPFLPSTARLRTCLIYEEVDISSRILEIYESNGCGRCSTCNGRKTHSAISIQKTEVKNMLFDFAFDKSLHRTYFER